MLILLEKLGFYNQDETVEFTSVLLVLVMQEILKPQLICNVLLMCARQVTEKERKKSHGFQRKRCYFSLLISGVCLSLDQGVVRRRMEGSELLPGGQ